MFCASISAQEPEAESIPEDEPENTEESTEEPVTEESEFDFSDDGETSEAPAEQTVSVAAASVGPDTNAAARALASLLGQLLS